MHKLNKIGEKIKQIGNRMVKCNKICNGVTHELREGIIPRCLWFDSDKKTKNIGLVIVALNPGEIEPDEQGHYKSYYRIRKTNGLYLETVEWLKDYLEEDSKTKKRLHEKSPFYTKLKNLLKESDLNNRPILWSELVKCQNITKKEKLDVQTIRTCIGEYLNKELREIPPEWPIIAVGRDAFDVLAYRYLNRMIIGIPHISGGWGISNKKLRALSKRIKKILRNNNKRIEARWLKLSKRN